MRIEVPMIGWSSEPDLGYRVGQLLSARWALSFLPGTRVRSVAAHCNPDRVQRTITLLVSFDRAPSGTQRIDGLLMARHLQQALSEAQRASVRTSGATPVLSSLQHAPH
jgi:hypothetical protein